jgi:hypothetical protein
MKDSYLKYRGKCKEECEKLIRKDPSLKMVRGYYHEPIWNTKEQHWWCKNKENEIVDPTKLQFPSGGMKEYYEEFDGNVECSECGKRLKEDDAQIEGRYCFCCSRCYRKFFGIDIGEKIY